MSLSIRKGRLLPSPIIELADISKKYHDGSTANTVLTKVSLTVSSGEMLAVVGTSGSGKSTLLNIIGLLDVIDSGKYFLQGRDLKFLSDDVRAGLRNQYFGFVFQQFHLLPRLTAWQNVGLPLVYRGLPKTLIQQTAYTSLSAVGLQDFGMRMPQELSGGQQQRLAIARALVGNPRVILADEPTGALDAKTGEEIINLLVAQNSKGCTVIIVTHDKNIAAKCKRRIELTDGTLDYAP